MSENHASTCDWVIEVKRRLVREWVKIVQKKGGKEQASQQAEAKGAIEYRLVRKRKNE